MRNLVSIVFIALVCACSKQGSHSEPVAIADTTANELTSLPGAAVSATTSEIEEMPSDVEYDTLIFPEYGASYDGWILAVGQYHGDEISEDVKKEQWFGLFMDDTETCYEVRETAIHAERVHDAILDDEGEMTGWAISAADESKPLMLLSRIDGLAKRESKCGAQVKSVLYPGDTARIQWGKDIYILHAEGDKRKDGENSYQVWNYKLFITLIRNEGTVTQLLVSMPQLEEHMTTILFTGDIDGDNLPDMLIDTSHHYNAFVPTLYLSKPAEESELLRIVAKHSSVGC